MVTFNPTIDFGTVLQTLAILAAFGYFIWDMQTRMAVMNNSIELFKDNVLRRDKEIGDKLEKVDQEITNLGRNVIDIARIEERISGLDVRLQELSNRQFSGRVSRTK